MCEKRHPDGIGEATGILATFCTSSGDGKCNITCDRGVFQDGAGERSAGLALAGCNNTGFLITLPARPPSGNAVSQDLGLSRSRSLTGTNQLKSIVRLYTMLQIDIHVSQHYKPRPITAFRRIVGRIVAILIGILLLLFVYYSFRYDFLPKRGYNRRYIVTVAGFGLLLTVGPLWYWFKEWRRSSRK